MINETFSEKKQKTLKVLDSIHNLPTIANVMIETTKLLEDSSTSTSTLSRIIGRDQGLSTKLLAIANSPIYGIPRKVSTIDFAILVLGYQEIKNIIIGLSIMETFKNMNDGVLDYKDLWLHSFLVGSLARRIALDLGYKISLIILKNNGVEKIGQL
jgi:HD-like signal output (HDOD) protein